MHNLFLGAYEIAESKTFQSHSYRQLGHVASAVLLPSWSIHGFATPI